MSIVQLLFKISNILGAAILIQTKAHSGIQKIIGQRLKKFPNIIFKQPGPNHHSCVVALPKEVALVLR